MFPAIREHIAAFFALSLLFSSAPLASGTRVANDPAQQSACVAAPSPARLTQLPRGLSNFGQVSVSLYRGGQPTTEGYRELKQMGVDVVISFRHEKGENTLERRAVEAHGMRFINFPWHPWDTPADTDVERFFGILAANPHSKIYVHCQEGRDRTGTMIALYRVAVDHWCPDSAVAEMRAYHYHHFWFPHLETYVQNFPQRLATDHNLATALTLPTAAHQ